MYHPNKHAGVIEQELNRRIEQTTANEGPIDRPIGLQDQDPTERADQYTDPKRKQHAVQDHFEAGAFGARQHECNGIRNDYRCDGYNQRQR